MEHIQHIFFIMCLLSILKCVPFMASSGRKAEKIIIQNISFETIVC